MKRTTLKVTRLEGARRQLQTAITLWFEGGDPVSVHSLVGSAYVVIHDLNRSAKGLPLMFDSPIIKKQFKKEAVSDLKAHMNFFKHADMRKGKPSDSIDFDPGLSEVFVMACVAGLQGMKLRLNDHEAAFLFWRMLHGPGGLVEYGNEVLRKTLSAATLAEVGNLERSQLLAEFLANRSLRQSAELG